MPPTPTIPRDALQAMSASANVVFAGSCTTLQGEPFVGVSSCSLEDGGSVSLDIFSGPFTRTYRDCSYAAELRDRWVVNTTCTAFPAPAGVNAFPTYFKLTNATCTAPAAGVYLTGLRESVTTECITPPGLYGTVAGDVCAQGAIAGYYNGRVAVAGNGSWSVTGFAPSDTTCATPIGEFSGASLPAECVPLSTDNTKRLYIQAATAYAATHTPSPSPSPSTPPLVRNVTKRTFLSSGSCGGVANLTETIFSNNCTVYGGLTGASSYACNDAGTGVVATGWDNVTACVGSHA